MISRHHSERDHSANSGRASTWSIRATSASETEILSTMGTLAVSGSLERVMRSKYPEQPGWNASVCASSQPRITRRRACAGRKTTCAAIRSKSLPRQGKISSRCWCGPPMSGPSGPGSSVPGSRGAVAQLVAHLHGMEGVRGSNPLSSTTIFLFVFERATISRKARSSAPAPPVPSAASASLTPAGT